MGRFTRSRNLVFAALLIAAAAGCSVSAADPPASPGASATATSEATETPTAAVPSASATSTPSIGDPTQDIYPDDIGDKLPAYTPVPPTATATGNRQVETMFGPVTCDSSVKDVELTHEIYPPELFDALIPMGRMWGSHVTPTDHMYFHLYEDRVRDMVRTPAAGDVVMVQRFPNDQSPFWGSSVVDPDYRVVIAHSCTLFSVYIHLGELAPEVREAVGSLARGQMWSASSGNSITLDAGDAVALLGGSAFDYSLHDESVRLTGFQVPKHYEGEPWKIHTVDPFDYMAEDIADPLLDKNERKVEPFGGRIDYDVRGTLAGNWFLDGTVDYAGGGSTATPQYWTGHLVFAYDHIDPEQLRVSIGRDIGLTHNDCPVCGGVYAVLDNYPDPVNITATSGIVEYELTGREHFLADSREQTIGNGNVLGTLLVQVLNDTTIRMEFFRGQSKGDVSVFTPAALVYRR